jgi:hypothetical protein
MNYPTFKFPNDVAHMLFDLGYSYAMLARTAIVLQWALTDNQDEQVEVEMQALLEEIEALQKGRLQTVEALYANADSAIEVLDKIVAAQEPLQ